MTARPAHPLPFSHWMTTSVVIVECEKPSRARKVPHAA
jgi:hypothetical protein